MTTVKRSGSDFVESIAPNVASQVTAEAAKELGRLTQGKNVRCIQVGGGTPCDGKSHAMSCDRIVAQCFVGDLDIAMEMVSAGQAKDWPKFSGGYYSTCKR